LSTLDFSPLFFKVITKLHFTPSVIAFKNGYFIFCERNDKMIWIKKARPYLLVCALAFYLLPLTGKYWGNEFLLVFAALPVMSFVISVVYGAKNGFHAALALSVGIIFLSTLFIFYNSTAWIYVIVYSAISAIGNGIGTLFHKRRN